MRRSRILPKSIRGRQGTRRYAKRDPEEAPSPATSAGPAQPTEVDELLEQVLRGPAEDLSTVRCPVIWCHGNHEDFSELQRLVGSSVLGPSTRSGAAPITLGACSRGRRVRVAAIGGGPSWPKRTTSNLVRRGVGWWPTKPAFGSPRSPLTC